MEEVGGFGFGFFGGAELDFDSGEDIEGHLAGMDGFDEEGFAEDGELANEAHVCEVGALAVDEQIDDHSIDVLQMREDLAYG